MNIGAQLSGILSHSPLKRELNVVRPAAAEDSPGGSAVAASISANDFLTLLVTEMKNQDPTAQTDPNEYVNQLVQVNSLEQLISINETLQAGLKEGTVTDPTQNAGR